MTLSTLDPNSFRKSSSSATRFANSLTLDDLLSGLDAPITPKKAEVKWRLNVSTFCGDSLFELLVISDEDRFGKVARITVIIAEGLVLRAKIACTHLSLNYSVFK